MTKTQLINALDAILSEVNYICSNDLSQVEPDAVERLTKIYTTVVNVKRSIEITGIITEIN